MEESTDVTPHISMPVEPDSDDPKDEETKHYQQPFALEAEPSLPYLPTSQPKVEPRPKTVKEEVSLPKLD